MGTLHSAASVIQIHFRYLRHLKEAGLLATGGVAQQRNQRQRPDMEAANAVTRSRARQEAEPENDLYIDSDEEDVGFQAHSNKQSVSNQRPAGKQQEAAVEREERQRWQAGLEFDLDSVERSIQKSHEDNGQASDYIHTTEKKSKKVDHK